MSVTMTMSESMRELRDNLNRSQRERREFVADNQQRSRMQLQQSQQQQQRMAARQAKRLRDSNNAMRKATNKMQDEFRKEHRNTVNAARAERQQAVERNAADIQRFLLDAAHSRRETQAVFQKQLRRDLGKTMRDLGKTMNATRKMMLGLRNDFDKAHAIFLGEEQTDAKREPTRAKGQDKAKKGKRE
ncbi:MAG: hypothetical protein H8E20_12875 [Verrucomicrobia bacterium]|nr:hypothetical protein [Verrucomicrobiota bacterium]